MHFLSFDFFSTMIFIFFVRMVDMLHDIIIDSETIIHNETDFQVQRAKALKKELAQTKIDAVNIFNQAKYIFLTQYKNVFLDQFKNIFSVLIHNLFLKHLKTFCHQIIFA